MSAITWRSLRLVPSFTQSLKNGSPMRTLTLSSRRHNEEATKKEGEPELPENEKKLSLQVEELNKGLTEEKEKNVELLDKYKRALADGENLRLRLTKQIDDAKQFGITSFCKDLLEVADVLSRATESVPDDEVAKNAHLKSLFEGLTMTKGTLDQIFKRHGLEQVNPLNEKFNPNYHEALFQIENKSVDVNTVLQVSKIGYKLKDRCLRPALVGVSK